MAYPITAGDILEAIREGAREGTLEGQKELFENGQAGVTLYGPNGQPISTVNRLPVNAEVSGTVAVDGAVEVTGNVGVSGEVDISDRENRKLGEVKATLTGHDVDTGINVAALSVVADDKGNPVLRVLDAAPHAYNENDDVYMVRSESSARLLYSDYLGSIETGGYASVVLGGVSFPYLTIGLRTNNAIDGGISVYTIQDGSVIRGGTPPIVVEVAPGFSDEDTSRYLGYAEIPVVHPDLKIYFRNNHNTAARQIHVTIMGRG